MDGNGTTNVPAVAEGKSTALAEYSEGTLGSMPAALALYLDDRLYERATSIAGRMAKADGMTPKHLIGKPEACFAVVSRAITWKLDPFAVGKCTYQTPGGGIGFEGKLVHAIIESSGKLDPNSGGVRYEHYGDWSKVQGRFEMRESKKDDDEGGKKKYAAATWTDVDARAGKPTDQAKYPLAQSCGVRVIAHLRGEAQPRILDFDLIQAQPRNSTLWATDPMTQICYTAVRRFGSVVAPSLIMGVPFDPQDNAAPIGERDITNQGSAEVIGPRSKSGATEAAAQAAATSAATTTIDKGTGEIIEGEATGTAAPTQNGDAAQQQQGDSAAAAKAASAIEGAGSAASDGMVKHITRLLEKNALSTADMEKAVGVSKVEGIDVATANQILKWIADPAGYKKP